MVWFKVYKATYIGEWTQSQKLYQIWKLRVYFSLDELRQFVFVPLYYDGSHSTKKSKANLKWTVLSRQLVWQSGMLITNNNQLTDFPGFAICPVNMRCQTKHTQMDRNIDNMQFLVCPVHRTFARQWYFSIVYRQDWHHRICHYSHYQTVSWSAASETDDAGFWWRAAASAADQHKPPQAQG